MIFALLLVSGFAGLAGIWRGSAAGPALFILTTASVATILLLDISTPLRLSF